MLDDDGFLAPGRVRVSPDELYDRFVIAFPAPTRRQALFDAWRAHLEQLQSILSVHAQWIGGSFISATRDPGDIDVITLFDGPAYDALPIGRQGLVDKLLSGPRTRMVYGIDAYPLAMYPDSHSAHKVYLSDRGYWDDWLGRKKGHVGERGYVEVAT